jgi:hypothetical protein
MLWKASINGIPVLRAVADTRAWEYLLENLRGREKEAIRIGCFCTFII